jgi:hypothetical protein
MRRFAGSRGLNGDNYQQQFFQVQRLVSAGSDEIRFEQGMIADELNCHDRVILALASNPTWGV